MKNLFLVPFAACFLFGAAKAQQIQPCITDETHEHYLQQHPEARIAQEQAQELFRNALRTFSKKGQVMIIPVVVHVIHEYGAENISKEQIEDQIRVLNEDFRRTNADKTNTRLIFQGVASDMEYEFVLAKKDPSGNCTDGIVRKASPLTNDARDDVKAVSYWPSNKYLNIWVVKTIENLGGDPGTITLGYAQFPWDRAGRPTTDGIVLRADYVGTIGTSSVANAGRVATHEIGHWLGLYHTFQGACATVAWGEQIDDTPPVAAPSAGCNKTANTCTNDNPDLPDQVENYMDYSNGNCQNMFTMGQKSAVDVFVSAYRSELISPANAIATGIDDPAFTCVPVPRADFAPVKRKICPGGSITFEDLSYNTSGSTRTWEFEGGTPATSSLQNPQVVYNTPGNYKVRLRQQSSTGLDTITREAIVSVLSPIGELAAPFNEGAESAVFPPKNWSLESADTRNWKRVTNAANSGNASIVFEVNTTTPNASRYSFTTTTIDLASIGSPSLSFAYAHARRNNSNEVLRVFASIDCGVTWQPIYQRGASQLETAPQTTSSFVPTAGQWKSATIALTAYAGKRNLMLRFEIQSNSGNNMYLDDINITSSTGMETLTDESIQLAVYPNPFAGAATVSFTLPEQAPVKMEVADITGKQISVVSNSTLESGAHTLQLNASGMSIKPGIYLLHLTVGNSRITRKILLLE